MKKLKFSLLFFILSFQFVFAEEDLGIVYENGSFIKGKTVFLWGDNVNMREKPSKKAKVIQSLPIGAPLKIIEMAKEGNKPVVDTMDKITEKWYKVSDSKAEGYVWGGLISRASFTYDFDRQDKEDLVLLGFIDGGHKNPELNIKKAEVRIVRNGKLYAKAVSEPMKFLYDDAVIGFDMPITNAITLSKESLFGFFLKTQRAEKATEFYISFAWALKKIHYGFFAEGFSHPEGEKSFQIVYPQSGDALEIKVKIKEIKGKNREKEIKNIIYLFDPKTGSFKKK